MRALLIQGRTVLKFAGDDNLGLLSQIGGYVFAVLCVVRAMNNENDPGQERDLQERIVSLIRANQQARRTPLTDGELQKLNAAARRLDQMLKATADEDQQALKNAAARLDQLLQDIAAGRDVTSDLKRRQSD